MKPTITLIRHHDTEMIEAVFYINNVKFTKMFSGFVNDQEIINECERLIKLKENK